jgi:negative regulator of sigma E activity
MTIFTADKPVAEQSRSNMWNSAAEISRLIYVAQIVQLIALALAAILALFILVASQRRDQLAAQILGRDLNRVLSSARPQTAEAKPPAPTYYDLVAQMDNAAEADDRPAPPRVLTPEQRSRLVTMAGRLRSQQRVFVSASPSDQEGNQYAEQLRSALSEAGWNVHDITLAAPEEDAPAGIDFLVPFSAKREAVTLWRVFKDADVAWSQIRYEKPVFGDGIEIRVGKRDESSSKAV